MAFDELRPEMSGEEFRLIRDLVYDRCGILYREEMKFVMERRLWPRLEQLQLSGYEAYHRYLRYDGQRSLELEVAIEALTTNETYFFREPLQLQALSEELLPLLAARNAASRRLRLWSAGCSTGEEAYTLAMLVRQSNLFDGWDVEIYGTDISRKVLATARKAEYGPSSLRGTTPEAQALHFDPRGLKVAVKPEVRALVSFAHLNLLDAEMTQLVPRMDLVMCRNVMIYFDAPARRRVLKLFYERLVEGGFLLLGHSESLISLTAAFELVHLKTDLVYKRPADPADARSVSPR